MPKTREDSVRDCCLKKRGRDEETPWDTIKARESRTFFSFGKPRVAKSLLMYVGEDFLASCFFTVPLLLLLSKYN